MRGSYDLDSEFYCTACGSRGIPIVRKKGRGREAGHLKKIYCFRCKEERNHAEVKPWTHYSYEDFLFEFNNGNFDESGCRKMSYGEFKTYMNNRKDKRD